MKRVLWAVLKLAVSGGLIVLLVRRIGLGPIVEAVRQVEPLWLLAGVLLILVSNLLGSQQWRVLLELAGVRLPGTSVVAYYLVGIFFNNFLPSSVGGDVSRIVDAGRASGRRAPVIGATLVDRLLGMTVIALLAAVAAARFGDRLADEAMARWVWLGVGLILLASAGSLGLIMSRRLSGQVEHWSARLP
ncbi:MAG: lysylphosphatidylglycerol synthase transmembrane domain-containing protein, partial [Candidatus Eiseniibacteriota bacterium]